jgi:hypothetical protein
MNTRYVPVSEDFDNFTFAASRCLAELLAGDYGFDLDEFTAPDFGDDDE